MELEGSDVVKFLNGPNTIRDGALVRFLVQGLNTGPVIELFFEIRQPARSQNVKLELREIQEFDFSYSKDNSPEVIEFVKCLFTEQGEFYLSLDPYDEREAFASDDDNEVFRSRFVKLTVCESADPQQMPPQ